MWFKQIQLFQFAESRHFSLEELTEKLLPLAFQPCLPSLPSSIGWVSPIDEEDAPLIKLINGCMIFCLQIEEKILPASVITQELNEKVKLIEEADGRKVHHKEKLSLKDEVVMTLLPRAFSKFTRLYAYIDTRNHWLVLGSTNTKKIEQFMAIFKKSISEKVQSFELKKLANIITHWLKNKDYPSSFSIEKSCLLQDPNQQNRTIRCQQQDLFANSIQPLIKDGFEVKQLALSWQDHVSFILADNFSLHGLKFQDEVVAQAMDMEPETKQQQFDADFIIMSETLTGLLKDLLNVFMKPAIQSKELELEAE